MSRELKTEPQGAQILKRWAKKWELVNETVLVRVLQRNRTNKMGISMHTELHICISGQYQNSQGKLAAWSPRRKFQLESRGSQLAEFSSPQETVVVLPRKAFNWWDDGRGNLFYSMSA